jgi:3-deoxy-D-arabino-heptulosonate 7-phosphate (DAHP) synthase
MQNYTLLRVAGRTGKPVLLKRGGDVSHHRELAARGRVRAGRR